MPQSLPYASLAPFAPSLLLLTSSGCVSLPKLAFNAPTSAPTVSISPASPIVSDALTAVIVADAVDPEGAGFSYRYTWSVDGSQVATGTTLSGGAARKGQVVTLDVIANDGQFDSPPGEASVTIVNSPPTDSNATISPSVPLTTDDLTVNLTASDLDEETMTWTIQWSDNGVEIPQWDGQRVVLNSATTSGDAWSVVATPADSEASGPTVTATVRIDDTPPTLSSVSLGPTDVKAGESLGVSCTGVADADGDAITIHYVWTVNGSVVEEDDGGTNELLNTPLYRGDTVVVTAYATDGQLTSATATSNQVTVNDSAPTVDSVTVSPDPGHETDTLTCTPVNAVDVDGDTIRYSYKWYIGSTASGTSDTLTGSSFSRGDSVSCKITPSDDGATGDAVTSNSVTIANSPPSFTDVSLNVSTATASTTLNATPNGWYDADGDSQHQSYAWYVNGVSSSSSPSYSGLVRGQVVYAEVTPNDGYANGTPVDSTSITVANATPTLSSVSINPSILYDTSSATAIPSGYADADGDTASYRYQWYLGGVAASGETGVSLAQALTVGEQVQVRVWPSDGTAEGNPASSSVLTVTNRSPVAVADLLTPEPITECDEIQLSAAGSSDPDGTSLDYNWTVTTRPAGAHRTTSNLDAATDEQPYFVVDADGTWTFHVTASDGSLAATDEVSVVVDPRSYNTDPVADAGSDQATSVDAACSTSSGYGTTCVACPIVTFALDGSASTDADGDPLDYAWTMAPTSGATLTGSDTETPTLTIGGMIPTYDNTDTVSVTLTLTTADCAGGTSTDAVTVTYDCTGI